MRTKVISICIICHIPSRKCMLYETKRFSSSEYKLDGSDVGKTCPAPTHPHYYCLQKNQGQ